MTLTWNTDWTFDSRRSPVLGLGGMVATSQPLAAQAGLDILRAGGNAADAAIATAAVLAVVEPTGTGLGGDAFALYFDAATKQVHAVNGHGRSPASLTLEAIRARGIGGTPPKQSIQTVTVPGTVAAWADTLASHGRMTLADVLPRAIEVAERGFPVTPVISSLWTSEASRIRNASPNHAELLLDGLAPRTGEVWQNRPLASVLREVAEGGPDAFYRGRAAAAIVEVARGLGGWMEPRDLEAHCSTFEPPISTTYRGHTVYECPPSGQGLVALIALNIVEGFDLASMDRRSPAYLHTLIEAVRLAFEDGAAHIADPALEPVPVERLLSREHADGLRARIDPHRSTIGGGVMPSSDTVYLSVVDGEGNACSFINSNYDGIGTGIVPMGCGFPLQNRGFGFVWAEGHPNSVGPSKRPYHTIMPAMVTDAAGELFACFGVMGGYHQPQGHLQVLANLIDHQLNPQRAVDEPRFSIYSDPPGGAVHIEGAVPVETMAALAHMGHVVVPATGADRIRPFGRAQMIVRDRETGVLWGGSDPRGDGAAVAY